MLGRKWREKLNDLFGKCDIMDGKILELEKQVTDLKKELKSETETREEELSPYFNPRTRLYDFRYGKDQQSGGSNK